MPPPASGDDPARESTTDHPLRSAAFAALRSDRLTLVFALVLATIALPYLVPILPAELPVAVSEGPFFLVETALVVLSLAQGIGATRHPEERRFWELLGGAFACWLGAELLVLHPAWTQQAPAFALTYDALTVAVYTLAILASTEAPHQSAGWSARQGGRFSAYLGTAIFAVGMTVYFDLLPLLLDPSAFASRRPAIYLFLALDLTLVVRFAALRRAAPAGRWRLLYGLVLATCLLMATGDVLDALRVSGLYAYRSGTVIDFLWYLIFVPIFLAGRLRRLDLPEQAMPAAAVEHPGSPLLTYAILVPFVHFALSGAGWIGGPTERARDLTALVVMAAILGLAHWRQNQLEAVARALDRDLDRARERLASAQKLEAVGRLAGGVAHDFNNQLAIILGYNELLRRETSGSPELVEATGAIQNAGERAAALTARLLAVGRRQTLVVRELDLDEFVAALRPTLADVVGPAIDLEHAPAARPVPALADPAGLESALLHLAANAREAMPRGGRLTLATSLVELASEQLPPLAPGGAGGYARLEVADTGVGMSAEIQARLFEPFFTTKAAGQGAGLGLAAVRGVVEQCGGFVTVESAPGEGSRFRIHLPAASGRGGERQPSSR